MPGSDPVPVRNGRQDRELLSGLTPIEPEASATAGYP
ncbi:hypothetical protein ACVWXO_003455 [Bradyrhizobium sp. LM2.7]